MKRYRITEAGYKYDKLIFYSAFSIVLLLIFYIIYINGFDFSTNIYFNCEQEICENPFIQLNDCKQSVNILWVIPLYTTKDCKLNCNWCNQKFLSRGEYGKQLKGKFLYDNLWWISIIIILMGLLLNHLIYNKNRPFDIEIPITEKIKINKSKIMEWLKEDEKPKDNKQN